MERLGTVLSNVICIDAFQSIETPDPLVNEKRARQRSVMLAYGACVFFWMLAFVAMPGTEADGAVQPDDLLWAIVRAIGQGVLGIAVLAAATALWMHVSYLVFRRRSGAR
jgi:hypothetical protein